MGGITRVERLSRVPDAVASHAVDWPDGWTPRLEYRPLEFIYRVTLERPQARTRRVIADFSDVGDYPAVAAGLVAAAKAFDAASPPPSDGPKPEPTGDRQDA